jgi:hypothetical protein
MNENDSQATKQVNVRKPPRAGMGRPAGSVNKATAAVREAIARMAEDNAENFVSWITEVAGKSPEKACDIYLRAIEYHIPKLARTEVTGDGGGPLSIKVVSGIDE